MSGRGQNWKFWLVHWGQLWTQLWDLPSTFREMLYNHPDVVCQALLLPVGQKMPLCFTPSWWLLFRVAQQAVPMERSQRHRLHHSSRQLDSARPMHVEPWSATQASPSTLQGPWYPFLPGGLRRGYLQGLLNQHELISKSASLKMKVLVVSDSVWPHKLGVGSHSLFWGIFPIQGLNLGLLHCGQILYRLSHQRSPLKPQCKLILSQLLSPPAQAGQQCLVK